MGLFDTVKNAVTGGAADVRINIGEARRGAGLPVTVHALAQSDVEIDSVYLLVRATESARFRESEFDDGEYERETESGSKVVYERRFDISGPEQLEEGEQYTWEAEVPIPEDANPSFNGEIIEHVWEIQAGLDAVGNDPDTGWQSFWVE